MKTARFENGMNRFSAKKQLDYDLNRGIMFHCFSLHCGRNRSTFKSLQLNIVWHFPAAERGFPSDKNLIGAGVDCVRLLQTVY